MRYSKLFSITHIYHHSKCLMIFVVFSVLRRFPSIYLSPSDMLTHFSLIVCFCLCFLFYKYRQIHCLIACCSLLIFCKFGHLIFFSWCRLQSWLFISPFVALFDCCLFFCLLLARVLFFYCCIFALPSFCFFSLILPSFLCYSCLHIYRRILFLTHCTR